MLCLTDEQQREFQSFQSECTQLNQEYIKLSVQCNQDVITALSRSPYIRQDHVKVMQGFNNKYNELLVQHVEQTTAYNQLSTEHRQLQAGSNFILWILLATWGFLFVKWLIKLERKMSKRDKPIKKPIHFPKRNGRK